MLKPDRQHHDLGATAGPRLAELMDVECESAFWRAINRVIAYVPEAKRDEVTEALLAATTAWAAEMTQCALYFATNAPAEPHFEALQLDGINPMRPLPSGPEVH